jgi:NAD(P)-dependent dehydrogenase (short-subunit alcohol dehydrogenase family)
VRGLVAAINSRLGPIDVLVLNATGPQPEARVTEAGGARELGPFGVTMNTVAPGFVPVERHADVPSDIKNGYLATVPVGRMGNPRDIAHAVSFLASEGAGFMTGQRIVVDGGRGLDI